MPITSEDIVPLNRVRADFTTLAEQAREGHEKLITRNGESYVALIDARRLDHYHRLERERIHLILLEDARRGLEDIAAGRSADADVVLAELQQRRSEKAAGRG